MHFSGIPVASSQLPLLLPSWQPDYRYYRARSIHSPAPGHRLVPGATVGTPG
jgi:hypothetical protein